MEFKIDTKNTYTILSPVINHADANLTAALRQKWEELRQSGSQNIIVDMHNCLKIDNASLAGLYKLHTDIYSSGESLVLTGLQEDVMRIFREHEDDMPLNVAPTMIE